MYLRAVFVCNDGILKYRYNNISQVNNIWTKDINSMKRQFSQECYKGMPPTSVALVSAPKITPSYTTMKKYTTI